MMRSIKPSTISGTISIPSSKSYVQRAIAIAALGSGKSVIQGVTFCKDVLAAMKTAEGLGAIVTQHGNDIEITGSVSRDGGEINCGESGLCIRMFSPIIARLDQEFIVHGVGSLKTRPLHMIQDALQQFGAICESDNGYVPLTIKGPLKGGEGDIDGSVTSQLLTGLLIALPTIKNDSILNVSNLKSIPYIDMTIEIMQIFGVDIIHQDYKLFTIPGQQQYRSCTYRAEGDWSAGAFWVVAGAISGDITLENLNPQSSQGDRLILDIVQKAGVTFRFHDGDLTIDQSELIPFEADLSNAPDLFPPLVALGAAIDGVSVIKGVSRLAHKESNRGETLRDIFEKLGVKIELDGDLMRITGGTLKGGAMVDSHNDHRIAMAAAVAALGGERMVQILNAESVTKSYPNFFEDLQQLKGIVI